MKRVLLRQRAVEDIDQANEHCPKEFPEKLEALMRAFDATFRRAARLPGSGSPRYERSLGITGLRALRTARFPYLVFFIESENEVQIVRVLHERRDLPALVSDE